MWLSGARAPGAKLAPVDERSLLDEAATRELCHLITPAHLRKTGVALFQPWMSHPSVARAASMTASANAGWG